MGGTGYIYLSDNVSETGFIWSCRGDRQGLTSDFSFSDCEQRLQDDLAAKNVTGVLRGQCTPIPARAIAVGFDAGIGESVINVVRV
jgi:hypothetical protein